LINRKVSAIINTERNERGNQDEGHYEAGALQGADGSQVGSQRFGADADEAERAPLLVRGYQYEGLDRGNHHHRGSVRGTGRR